MARTFFRLDLIFFSKSEIRILKFINKVSYKKSGFLQPLYTTLHCALVKSYLLAGCQCFLYGNWKNRRRQRHNWNSSYKISILAHCVEFLHDKAFLFLVLSASLQRNWPFLAELLSRKIVKKKSWKSNCKILHHMFNRHSQSSTFWVELVWIGCAPFNILIQFFYFYLLSIEHPNFPHITNQS